MMIAKHIIKRIMVNNGSSIDIFFYDAFVCVNLFMNHLKLVSTLLVGFIGDLVEVKEEITLLVIVGSLPR